MDHPNFLGGHRPIFWGAHPVGGAEIDGLGEVVALVEAAVVRPGEGDDEFAGALVGPHDLKKGGRTI